MITFLSLGFKGFFLIQNLPSKYYSLIDCVVVGRDEGVKNDYSKELITWCKERKLPYLERSEFNILKSSSDYLILLGWRWLINPPEKKEIIVFHDSLLPKYRGFNPLVTALIEGDEEIGATAIFANSDFDSGNIIFQKSIRIKHPIKINQVIQKVANLYLEMFLEIASYIEENRPIPSVPQNNQQATYSLWRDEDDYFIDWTMDSDMILRKIYASGEPYLGAKTNFEGEKLRIFDAKVVEDVQIVNRTPGKVIFKKEGNPVVVCGQGLLMITDIRDDSGNSFTFPRFRVKLF
ncbi:methionyl-tRNA formyltransferase [Algoriphagus limi]|uniref:Methionyl-tRNA formyltransferase n=1 Tax=Algoriphagus limi TaxID=2975273 RepID=A0ABT2G4X5_9BACT|nr:formyltransferase family protein [Algoriphagus limi]MCS5489007.1 hypothetical protein [Algoriphagus limi]